MTSVLISLIPAAFGVLGAFVGGWITSRATIKRIDFDVKQLRYRSKADAYSAFIAEYQRFLLSVAKECIKDPDSLSDEEMDAGIRFAGIYSAALLQAPDELRGDLVLLYSAALDAVRTGDNNSAARLYSRVIDKMHKDLENTLIR